MMTVIPKILSKVWPYLAGAALLVGAYLYVDNRGYERAEKEYKAQISSLRKEITNKTNEAKLKDTENARRVEQKSVEVSRTVSKKYQDDITELRARYERLRLRPRDNQSGVGRESLSSVSNSSAGLEPVSCEVGLPSEDALIASLQAYQLKRVLEWIEEQKKIYDQSNVRPSGSEKSNRSLQE